MLSCPIRLYPEDNRDFARPIFRPEIYKFYEKSVELFWTLSELKFDGDSLDHQTVDPKISRGVDIINIFFAVADKWVNVNVVKKLKDLFPIPEVGWFYDQQMSTENIHALSYSTIIEELNADLDARRRILESLESHPDIKALVTYIQDSVNGDWTPQELLLRSACAEGIFFYGAFAYIYWLSDQGLYKGMAHANEFIARDEGLHTEFALFLYSLCDEQLSVRAVHKIFREATDLAKKFASIFVPDEMRMMNDRLMHQYLESQCDSLLSKINVMPLYGTKQPFAFVDMMNLKNKTNFFERRVSDYRKEASAQIDDGPIEDF